MKDQISKIKKYKRAADYLAAAQIYLQDNFFLREKLEAQHVKDRLLGHWGTVPGQTFIYANLNNLICKTGAEMFFISGPGHGFPAVQSNLFLEGTLSEIYGKQIPYNEKGIEEIVQKFSWPYGYPSHLNPGAPGAILEGGELGYSLSTAFGAVFDNPNLIAACVIGDGEAETATINAAWHSIKFLNPAESGAVLPFVHLNGYKISGPTILSQFSNEDLKNYFSGMGWEALVVEGDGDALYEKMLETVDYSYKKIRKLQEKAKNGNYTLAEKWPVVILKTPKGWGTISEFAGEKIEGNSKSHQVIFEDCKKDPEKLELIEEWLKSYKIEELLKDGIPNKEISELIPSSGKIENGKMVKGVDLRMGMCKHTYGGEVRKKLLLPYLEKFETKGEEKISSMKKAGDYLKEIFELNEVNKNFRLFSPDETYSNKIDKVFEATSRAYLAPVKPWEKDLAPDGRVMEMLSEHTLQGWLEGYLLTGRHGLLVSYEAFIQVIASMVDQYGKFLYASREFAFRKPLSSLNFILSSLGWRQDHNGFSHQNPGFVSGLLDKHGDYISVYFPADANSMLVTLEEIFSETNQINVVVAGKREQTQWLTLEQARESFSRGALIWDFLSDEEPDVVIGACGDYVTNEAIEGLKILKENLLEARVRFVNVGKLTALGIGTEYHSLSDSEFEEFFTKDKEIIFSYHGYSADVKKLVFGHEAAERFTIHGYEEEGSTTTPVDMLVRNGVSRWQVAKRALEAICKTRPELKEKCADLVLRLEKKLESHKNFIKEKGVDPEDLNKV